MSSLVKTLRMRHRRLDVEKCAINSIKTIGDFTLVESNSWYGIYSNKGLPLLDPVYDHIDMMDDICMCIVKVKDTYQLHELSTGKSVDLLEMKHYQRFGDILEVTTDDGVGLFSCRMQQLLVPPKYQEATHAVKGRYLWVKTIDGEYAFYDTQKTVTVKCPKGTSECLDGPEDYMFVVVDHRVYCINETGNFDSEKLRTFALRNNGRVRLNNYNRHISVITDVYGKIIN